jgi:hypothetical protein
LRKQRLVGAPAATDVQNRHSVAAKSLGNPL